MAFLTCWHMTNLPTDIVEIVEKDLQTFDSIAADSQIMGAQVDKVIRNSKNAWIPTSHWIGGWLWYYIDKVNRENFCYDLTDIDGGSIQYTQYGEGQFYNWHQDADIDTFYKPQLVPGSGTNMSQDQVTLNGEYVRKLSFALQLSDPSDYTGGEVQFLDNGGAAVYKGCEREHWRDPLQSRYGKWENKWRTFRKKEDDTYHHQIFLHYVNAQGPFVHHANDR